MILPYVLDEDAVDSWADESVQEKQEVIDEFLLLIMKHF